MNMTQLIKNIIDGLIYLFIGPFTVIGTVPLLLLQLDASWGLPNFTSESMRFTGFMIMNLGALLALWCTWLIFRHGGTPIPSRPAIMLVSSGPYAMVRHPMMHSLLIVGFGELLVTGSLLFLIWIPIAMRAGVLFISHYEEPVLMARFGDQYRSYCKNVPRWLPRRGMNP